LFAHRLYDKPFGEKHHLLKGLMIHNTVGRMLLKPASFHMLYGNTSAELCWYPSMDDQMLCYEEGQGWVLHGYGDSWESRPWNQENFYRAAQNLAEQRLQ